MAQRRYGLLTDQQIKGRTTASGTLVAEGGQSKWDGVVSAGGYDGAPVLVGQSAQISSSALGANLLIASADPIILHLPPLGGRFRNFRFVVAELPSAGAHEIQVHAEDVGTLWGGINLMRRVPSGVYATGDDRIIFNDGGSVGARVSLTSDGKRWYIAEGFGNESDSIEFGKF